MHATRFAFFLIMFLLSLGLATDAFASSEEEALWIEVEGENSSRATIALSVDAAWEVLIEGKDELFTGKTGKIERKVEKMLRDVLEDRIEEGEVTDPEDGTVIRAYKRMLEVPGRSKKGGSVAVLDIYKEGEKTFSLRVPDITVESASDDGDVIVQTHVGWKQFLPFLAETGGFVYIRSEGKEEAEIWLYVE
ncbi:MAG: hypothetical protein KAJ12_06840 [Bacteroidetes bacterium]|nr:hypothetical protein [Bacteroidota bacterium]